MKDLDDKTIIDKTNSLYDTAIKKHGVSSSSVLWDDQQTQYLRFYELVKLLDLEDGAKTVLDIGCGNGELYKFLNFLGFRGKYVGVDVNKKLIDQAKKIYPGVKFFKKDILTETLPGKFDYVLMSGLFNTNVGQSDIWVKKFTKKMFSFCKEVLVFNAISTYVNYKDEQMYYLDPTEVMDFCIQNLSPRVTLTHHNMPYNYTVLVYKNADWRSIKK